MEAVRGPHWAGRGAGRQPGMKTQCDEGKVLSGAVFDLLVVGYQRYPSPYAVPAGATHTPRLLHRAAWPTKKPHMLGTHIHIQPGATHSHCSTNRQSNATSSNSFLPQCTTRPPYLTRPLPHRPF